MYYSVFLKVSQMASELRTFISKDIFFSDEMYISERQYSH